MTETVDSNATVMYTFRFGSSDKSVQLTQQQLNDLPYLATFISHKDDFLSIQNENGEYVLNSPIEYNCFMTILRTITYENPYTLFNELSEDENILDVLQLRDFLGINSFPSPLLKNESLALSNSIDIKNEENHVKYHRANLSEARQTAAQFIIALTKNEYNLHNHYTMKRIFTLTKYIVSNATIFSSKFRRHTLTVVRECCYPFLSKNRQNLLNNALQRTQYHNIDALMYLYDDDQSCPDDFKNTFAWRGCVTIEVKQTNPSSIDIEERRSLSLLEESNSTLRMHESPERFIVSFREVLRRWDDVLDALNATINRGYRIFPAQRNQQTRKKKEAQSARSERFNTLPKRPKVDKFKHRCGPKAQKYR